MDSASLIITAQFTVMLNALREYTIMLQYLHIVLITKRVKYMCKQMILYVFTMSLIFDFLNVKVNNMLLRKTKCLLFEKKYL